MWEASQTFGQEHDCFGFDQEQHLGAPATHIASVSVCAESKTVYGSNECEGPRVDEFEARLSVVSTTLHAQSQRTVEGSVSQWQRTGIGMPCTAGGWWVNSGTRYHEDRETGDFHDMVKHLRQPMLRGSVGCESWQPTVPQSRSLQSGQAEWRSAGVGGVEKKKEKREVGEPPGWSTVGQVAW